jgi:hypothetical protein
MNRLELLAIGKQKKWNGVLTLFPGAFLFLVEGAWALENGPRVFTFFALIIGFLLMKSGSDQGIEGERMIQKAMK